jgi:hypothetical protein
MENHRQIVHCFTSFAMAQYSPAIAG